MWMHEDGLCTCELRHQPADDGTIRGSRYLEGANVGAVLCAIPHEGANIGLKRVDTPLEAANTRLERRHTLQWTRHSGQPRMNQNHVISELWAPKEHTSREHIRFDQVTCERSQSLYL